MKASALALSFVIIIASLSSLCMAQGRQMGGVGITVFTGPNYQGKSATFREDVSDLQPIGLNDRISSLRVAPGEQWEICEHSNFQGRCVVVSGEEPDLRRNSWNGLISSMRRVSGRPSPPAQSGGDYIVLFDRTNYRGNPINYNGPNPSLTGRAQSVTIGRGVWELCDRQNYGGRCVTLEQSVPDLGVYNLRNRVYSVRPLGSGGFQPPPSTSDWYMVIFDQTSYRGSPSNYKGTETNIFKLAGSVTIGKGVWEVCQGRNFTGRCVTLDQSVPDLRSYNIRQVASLRPVVRPQPR